MMRKNKKFDFKVKFIDDKFDGNKLNKEFKKTKRLSWFDKYIGELK